MLTALVAVDGTVLETKVEKSSGSRALDRAASYSLSNCKFKPASRNGQAAEEWTRVEYV